MYTILCVIELLKAACPSTLPLKNGGDDRTLTYSYNSFEARSALLCQRLHKMVGILGVEPRITPPQSVVISISLYSHKKVAGCIGFAPTLYRLTIYRLCFISSHPKVSHSHY
jgi:hypothetical protein